MVVLFLNLLQIIFAQGNERSSNASPSSKQFLFLVNLRHADSHSIIRKLLTEISTKLKRDLRTGKPQSKKPRRS